MNTDQLIDALATDAVTPPPPPRALTLALVPGLAIAILIYAYGLGIRPDFVAHLAEPRFLFKLLLLDLLAALAGVLTLRMARPAAPLRPAIWLLAVPPVLLAAAIGVELAVVPRAEWGDRLVGENSMFCLRSIPLLGIAPLAAILLALRLGAPAHPAWAGAAAGLFAGAIGAALYATHCPDDSPLFVAVWYSIAIAMLSAIGAAAGAWLLRW